MHLIWRILLAQSRQNSALGETNAMLQAPHLLGCSGACNKLRGCPRNPNDLIANSNNQVTLPGGELYRSQGIVLSAFENDNIQHYHGSKMFMGTPGIGDFGVMESDPLLIRSEQKLRKQSDQLIILADSSKLGKRSNLIFSRL